MKITRRQLRQIIRESLEEADDRDQKLTIEKVIAMLEKGQSIKDNSVAKKLLGDKSITLGKFKHGKLVLDNLSELVKNIEREKKAANGSITAKGVMSAIRQTFDVEDIAAIITPIILASVPGGRLLNVIAEGLVEKGLEAASRVFREAMIKHAINVGLKHAVPLAGDFQSSRNVRGGSLAETSYIDEMITVATGD